MSVEEDSELRDLVAQTLEINGCLAKIRAQLRAGIFLALDDDECLQKKEPFLNKKVKEHLESQQGKLMFCLVREFLEYFNLEFTISVYEPETYAGSQYYYDGRSKIVKELDIPQLDDKSTVPLLIQLIQIAQSKTSQVSTQNYNSNSINEKDIINLNKPPNIIDPSISNNVRSYSEQESKTIISKTAIITNNFNETFNLSPSHQLTFQHENVVSKNNLTDIPDQNKQGSDVSIVLHGKEHLIEKDDTFEGTSSIAEDSIRESIQDESVHSFTNAEKSSNNEIEKLKGSPDQMISDSEISPPVVKDGKFSKFDLSFEKLKLSPQKPEKLKTKTSLTSLTDLSPPQPMNKSRCNDMLLPSLYSKEFKEKSNSKDIDKMFDFNSLDNYEEDFMSGSEAELVQKKTEVLSSNNLPEVETSVKLNSDLEVDNMENSDYSININKNRDVNDSVVSSIVSEDYEFNSNVENILNST